MSGWFGIGPIFLTYSFPLTLIHPEAAVGLPEDRKKIPWVDGETMILLELWGDDSVQQDLKHCPYNSHIYSEISEKLNFRGYYRTAEQCHTRIKRLKAGYRQCQETIR